MTPALRFVLNGIFGEFDLDAAAATPPTCALECTTERPRMDSSDRGPGHVCKPALRKGAWLVGVQVPT